MATTCGRLVQQNVRPMAALEKIQGLVLQAAGPEASEGNDGNLVVRFLMRRHSEREVAHETSSEVSRDANIYTVKRLMPLQQ